MGSNTTRRDFLIVASALAAGGCVTSNGPTTVKPAEVPAKGSDAEKDKQNEAKLISSPPVLQNPAETSMGVGFAVSA